MPKSQPFIGSQNTLEHSSVECIRDARIPGKQGIELLWREQYSVTPFEGSYCLGSGLIAQHSFNPEKIPWAIDPEHSLFPYIGNERSLSPTGQEHYHVPAWVALSHQHRAGPE
jgi:hypothetical protein